MRALPAVLKFSNEQIREALTPFAISPSEAQIDRIREYVLLLIRWNQTINLTSVTDPIEIVGRHFGESIYASKLLPVENCRLADVGSGAGFPGLALKIGSPSVHLILIESNRKKCAFLAEVLRILEFTNVEILSERFEQIRPEKFLANVITSRAVGEFKQLLRWSSRALARRGHLALWVGAEDATRVAKFPGWIWQPTIRIPESQRRYILIGRPIDESSPNG